MVCFLDLFRSCTSAGAVCIKTCSPVNSKESSTVMLLIEVQSLCLLTLWIFQVAMSSGTNFCGVDFSLDSEHTVCQPYNPEGSVLRSFLS